MLISNRREVLIEGFAYLFLVFEDTMHPLHQDDLYNDSFYLIVPAILLFSTYL